MVDFNPWLAYRALSQTDKLGFLSSKALAFFLSHSGTKDYSEDLITRFFSFRRTVVPSHIDYQDFLEVILPNRSQKPR